MGFRWCQGRASAGPDSRRRSPALSSSPEAAGLTPKEAKAERIAGWVAADEEWRNRGLGGFRAWCETEGAAASRRFLEAR